MKLSDLAAKKWYAKDWESVGKIVAALGLPPDEALALVEVVTGKRPAPASRRTFLDSYRRAAGLEGGSYYDADRSRLAIRVLPSSGEVVVVRRRHLFRRRFNAIKPGLAWQTKMEEEAPASGADTTGSQTQ